MKRFLLLLALVSFVSTGAFAALEPIGYYTSNVQKTDADELTKTSVSPGYAASVDVLETVRFTMNAPLVSVNSTAKVEVRSMLQGVVADATMSIDKEDPTVLVVTLNKPVVDKGSYRITVEAGSVSSADADNVEFFTLVLVTGKAAPHNSFEASAFSPAPNGEDPSAVITSLLNIKVSFPAWVGGLDPSKRPTFGLYDDPESMREVSIEKDGSDWGTVNITLPVEIKEPGTYLLHIPEGTIYDNNFDEEEPDFGVGYWNATYNPAYDLIYRVGEGFDVKSISPENLSTVKSLKEITLFMSARVGGFAEGAKVDVLRNGEKVDEATLDWGMEPGSNEVAIILDNEQTEYGHYAIVVPAGVIFDERFDPVDPFFSGAASNEEFVLEYNVGEFGVSAVSPENLSTVKSLKEITLFMSARVGGFAEGATFDVLRNGEKVCDATLDWGMEPYANEVAVKLSAAQDAPGVYTIEIPAGVIFDERFDSADPFFSGAASNEAITLTYTILESVDVPYVITPADGSVVSSICNFTINFEGIDRATGKGNPGITLYNAAGEEVTSTGKYAIFNGFTDTELTFELLDEVTEKGDYRLVIPAGVFSYYKVEFDQEKADRGVDYPYTDVLVGKNDEIVLNLTIGEPDGISGIGADAKASGDVYNLGGVRVSGKLPKGVYIVNGKKVYVK